MTETTITDAIVWPEDQGTGAPVDIAEGDWASAAYLGSIARARGTSGYVDAGIGLSYNPSDDTMDIGAGLAFVRYTGSSTIQLTSSSYDASWDRDLVFMVSVPAVSNLSLDASAVNEIYLAIDPTVGDGARYRYGSAVSEPANPHIKIGEIDTAAETTTELARGPVGSFDTLSTTEIQGDIIAGDPALTDITGPNLFINGSGQLTAANMRTDYLDDGTEVVSNSTAVNFGTNLSVTDDGGIPLIDATDTNTHTSISNDGTQVLSDVSDVNFGTNVEVSADGDGSVSVSATDTDTNTHTTVSDDGSEVVPDVSDINFGSNVGVSDDGDGSVTIDATETTTLFMSDYAPNGGTVDSAFATAVSDAQEGDRIVFDHSDYELTQQTVINKPLTIDQTPDSTLRCTNTSNNNAHILFEGGGLGQSTTTTEIGNVGERTLSVNDETVVTAGDYVLLIEDEYTAVNVNSQIQFAEVESTATGSITLMSALSKEFVSGTTIYQVDLLEGPEMKNLSTQGGGTRHLQFRWCKAPVYDSVSISEYLEISLYALDCWQPRYRDVQATDPEGTLSGEGEPISLYRCTDGYIESPRVYDCRRGIDFAWGTRNVTVVDPILYGCLIAGISVHQDDEAGTFHIEGGEIVCQTTEEDTAHNGQGISMSSSAVTSIDGTRIVARANGIIASGETHATNVTIEPSDGTPEGNAGILVQSNDCSFIGCRLGDPDGQFDQGVWIDASGGAIQNVEIDMDMDFTGENMIYVDGRSNPVKNVRIRGNYDLVGSSSNQGFLIEANNSNRVENVDISVSLENHPEQGVRLETNTDGVLDNINVHDSYFDCTQAAVYSNGSGTFGTLRVRDSVLDTGSTSVSFNEPVSKIFVTNNGIAGTIDTGDNSYTTESGNL
ncbi:hypothetical protein [Halocatena halophila]|uniref:hypothetical protein n=1 Tax=Halocatena halophila TaxID=2814576 RepID=UPI002ED0E22B